jgi:hypothetical protein
LTGSGQIDLDYSDRDCAAPTSSRLLRSVRLVMVEVENIPVQILHRELP